MCFVAIVCRLQSIHIVCTVYTAYTHTYNCATRAIWSRFIFSTAETWVKWIQWTELLEYFHFFYCIHWLCLPIHIHYCWHLRHLFHRRANRVFFFTPHIRFSECVSLEHFFSFSRSFPSWIMIVCIEFFPFVPFKKHFFLPFSSASVYFLLRFLTHHMNFLNFWLSFIIYFLLSIARFYMIYL